MLFCFVYWAGNRTFCFAKWTGSGMVAFGCWAGIKCFCTKKVHVKMIWKQFLYNFMVLPHGPVQNALFCLMDRYRNVCVWFMARNCGFPKVGIHGCQRGNHRLPLQGTAGSQRLERLVPNLGTRGYHCKQLPVPRGWNSWFPTWEPKVTMARNCRFPDLETYGSQPGNQRLLLQGIAGSRKLEFMFSKLSGYHCKELRVPKAWDSWFQAWKSNVTSGRICWLQKVRPHGS